MSAKATRSIHQDADRPTDGVDGFIERNREALNASIRQSRSEMEAGTVSARGIADVISDGRKRHRAD